MRTLPASTNPRLTLALPTWPIHTVRDLADQRVWLAGGPVRDILLDRPPRDWDFATEGDALQLARNVANEMGGAFYALDAKRGTGRAIVRHPDTQFLITLDFARLRGSSIISDLRMRDFTMNAMASTLDGQLIDPTGGAEDLARRSLRMTDSGAFRHDPVRLIRAVRQATQFQFALEPETYHQMKLDAATIKNVAPERVRAELVKLLQLSATTQGLMQLDQTGLLPHILPELHTVGTERALAAGDITSEHVETELQHMARLIETVALLLLDSDSGAGTSYDAPLRDPGQPWYTLAVALPDFAAPLIAYLQEPVGTEVTRQDLLKWCALFLRAGISHQDRASASVLSQGLCEASASAAEQAMTRLRFSRAATSFVTQTVAECWRVDQLLGNPLNRRRIYRYFRCTQDTGVGAVVLSLANTIATEPVTRTDSDWVAHLEVARALLEAYLHQRQTLVLPVPLLTGRDLIALGLNPGPRLGEVLEALREAQAVGDVSTRSEALAWATRMLAGQ